MKITAHLEFDTFGEAEKVFRHLGILDATAPATEAKHVVPVVSAPVPAAVPAAVVAPTPQPVAAAPAAANALTIADVKTRFKAYIERKGGRTAFTAQEILKAHGVTSINNAPVEKYAALVRAFDTAGPEMPLGEAA